VRRSTAWVVGVVVLAAAGFAVASIASGSSSVVAQTTTGTTGTTTGGSVTTSTTTPPATQTVTVTQTTTVTHTSPPAKVTICHRASAKKFVTIKVAASALFAHFRHGDLPGPCTAAKIKQIKKNLKAKAKRR
jgi:hypothetical protein